jgi:hypothetical protein
LALAARWENASAGPPQYQPAGPVGTAANAVSRPSAGAICVRPRHFDPRTAQQVFSIAANDNAMVLLGLGLLDRIRQLAGPGIQISFRSPNADLISSQVDPAQVWLREQLIAIADGSDGHAGTL